MTASAMLAALAEISVPQLLLIAAMGVLTSLIGGVAGYGTGALMPLVLVPLTLAPWLLGFSGPVYAVAAAMLGLGFLVIVFWSSDGVIGLWDRWRRGAATPDNRAGGGHGHG